MHAEDIFSAEAFSNKNREIIYNFDKRVNEESEIKPQNNYGWSKLGGECVTKLISNSLILRCALCDIPFRHNIAFDDVYRNSITHKEVAKIILKLKNKSGIINIGGKYQSVYNFVSQYQKIEKKLSNDKIPSIHLDISKMNNILGYD